MDNLANLEGVAEFYDPRNSEEFIPRLASMFVTQEPACIVIRGIPVKGDVRPDDLAIEINPEHRIQSGQKYSEEIFELLNEQIGGNRIKSEFGNVIRLIDLNNPSQIRVEPTHTHPDDRVSNMFCNISDGVISKVTFVDEVWNSASEEQKAMLEKYKFIDIEGGIVLWNENFVGCNDVFERLEKLYEHSDTELVATAKLLTSAIQECAREYHLVEGDMIFFAQLKTLRGAQPYPAPESGIEKRWYQSMTFGWEKGVWAH